MFLSNFSIKNPVTTVAIVIILMALGLIALKNLRVNQIPDVQEPVMVVNFPYPGASPETVEREIINRVEKSIQSIPQVKETRSTASESNARIVIIFNFKKNMAEAGDDVRNAIAAVRYKLPLEMREPVLWRFDPSSDPVMGLALSSNSQTHTEISRLAEDTLADRLRGIDGVSQVEVSGSLNRELSVLLHAQKLREFNVSVSDVVNALRNQNTTAPVGRVKGALDEQSIRLVGRIESPVEFNDVVVKRQGDEVVRLGQVATVEDGVSEPSGYSLRNSHPNVSIDVIRSRDSSSVAVAERVRKEVDEINKTLPAGTKLEVTRDGGKDAQSSLNNVIEALIFGAGLTIFVVYAFLNSWRSTLITGLSLPTSAIAAFIAVWLCGFTLNFMTLLGLSLAIGVLIDDAIVVRENIVRHIERGSDRKKAAMEGTAEIGLAVAATTFSIIAVFVPVAFMGGGAGEWFRPFAVTVAASVLVSLFIAFTLDPMLSAYWGDTQETVHKEPRGLGKVFHRFNVWFDHQADRYGNVISWALHHRLWMALIAFGALIIALILQGTVGGSEFLPKSDYGTIAVEVRTPSSASLEYARDKLERAAQLARTIPETKNTDTNANAGGGRVWIDIGKVSERRRSAVEIAADLREKLKSLVGAEYVVLDDLNNGAQKPVQIRFYGADTRKLMEITNDFMAQLRNVKGAVDVGLSEKEPKDELRIELNRGLANQLGISVGDAAQTLRVAFAGVEVGDWVDPIGESRDVSVRLHPDDRVNASNIEHLPVPVAGTSMMVPLEQIATITMDKGPAQIQHFNGKRTVTVSANVQGRAAGEVTGDAMKLAKAIEFPPGFGIELGGASRDQQEVFSEMFIALIMGIFVMYLVLVMQFGSFTAPLPVMMSLPLSLIGVVLALLVTGGTLNLMSFIGIIMLMGLVAKNAILLLDCARKEEEQGVDREEALMHAGRVRLRPILMTTFALIAGMLPVAIGMGEGGEFYRPMAVAIIGGTITSTLLTLLVIPSFYDSIELNWDRAVLKYRARALLGNPFVAFLQTVGEAYLTLKLWRFTFRCVRWLFWIDSPREHPVELAARLHGMEVPSWWVPRPKPWQSRQDRQAIREAKRNPYAPRPSVDVETRLGTAKTAEPPLGAG
jgi:hydrophobic/amphiphilic exporter-1 (mainly G- bacteria), HAE1 family